MADGVERWPVSGAKMEKAILWGKIGPQTHVWTEGWADWKELSQVPEFTEALAKAASSPRVIRRKEKTTAALFAFLLGGLGAHRFYLGQWTGVVYPLFTIPLYGGYDSYIDMPMYFLFPHLVAVAEGLAFLMTGKEKWDRTFNSNRWGVYSSLTGGAAIGAMAITAISFFLMIIESNILFRAKEFCAAARSDLANLAIAEDEYFSAHKRFHPAVLEPGKKDIVLNFKPSADVNLAIQVFNEANPPRFLAKGTHAKCRSSFVWDSAKDGLQPGD
jgi:hypothetical protein